MCKTLFASIVPAFATKRVPGRGDLYETVRYRLVMYVEDDLGNQDGTFDSVYLEVPRGLSNWFELSPVILLSYNFNCKNDYFLNLLKNFFLVFSQN